LIGLLFCIPSNLSILNRGECTERGGRREEGGEPRERLRKMVGRLAGRIKWLKEKRKILPTLLF
jgi:hypothetical protein